MLLVSSAILFVKGQSVAMLWANMSFFRMSLLLLYHLLTAHGLWPAPVYCWLLFVSGWSRRATFLWAVLPMVAIAGFERIAFGTWHFAMLVASRFIGDAATVTSATPGMAPTNPMIHVDPGFLTSPGLWIGLLVSAAFLAAAIQLRRSQGPI
jgi:ABC-2 type transport system permease protein